MLIHWNWSRVTLKRLKSEILDYHSWMTHRFFPSSKFVVVVGSETMFHSSFASTLEQTNELATHRIFYHHLVPFNFTVYVWCACVRYYSAKFMIFEKLLLFSQCVVQREWCAHIGSTHFSWLCYINNVICSFLYRNFEGETRKTILYLNGIKSHFEMMKSKSREN